MNNSIFKLFLISTLFLLVPIFSHAQNPTFDGDSELINDTDVFTPFPGVNDGNSLVPTSTTPTINTDIINERTPTVPNIVPYSAPRTMNSLDSGTPQGTSIFEQIAPANGFGSQPLGILLNQIFYVGLGIAVVLAIVMIVRGGIQYMTIDAAASKDSGKKMVQAALGGLTLAFAGILILNTINPNITNLNITLQALRLGQFGGNDTPPITSGTRPDGTPIPAGNYGSWDETAAGNWVNGLQNGTRSADGRLVVSVYSASGDSVTDSNTAAGRGNANNLLREGSVALSPDLIAQHRPALGSEIFINGTSVGFYEDTTSAAYRNTVDVYDQNVSMGSRDILKNVPSGQWNITFGNPRPQVSNP